MTDDLLNGTRVQGALFDVADVCPAKSVAVERTPPRSASQSTQCILRGLNRNAEKSISRGYRTVNLKTVCIDLAENLARELAQIDGSRVAYCVHHEDGFVDHVHLVAQFSSPQHIKKALYPIASADPCFYLRPCRLFRSSYRYLAHLDNPEKHRVEVSSIVHLGDWDGTDLSKWQAARITTVTMNELLCLARDYLRHNDLPNSIGFAIFLDDNLVNSRSALSGLRMMGISLDELFLFARKLLNTETESIANATED